MQLRIWVLSIFRLTVSEMTRHSPKLPAEVQTLYPDILHLVRKNFTLMSWNKTFQDGIKSFKMFPHYPSLLLFGPRWPRLDPCHIQEAKKAWELNVCNSIYSFL